MQVNPEDHPPDIYVTWLNPRMTDFAGIDLGRAIAILTLIFRKWRKRENCMGSIWRIEIKFGADSQVHWVT